MKGQIRTITYSTFSISQESMNKHSIKQCNLRNRQWTSFPKVTVDFSVPKPFLTSRK